MLKFSLFASGKEPRRQWPVVVYWPEYWVGLVFIANGARFFFEVSID